MPAPASSDSQLTADVRRMLEAIERLPEGEREAFELVRIQGMSQAEAARMLEVSVATVNRRLSRACSRWPPNWAICTRMTRTLPKS